MGHGSSEDQPPDGAGDGPWRKACRSFPAHGRARSVLGTTVGEVRSRVSVPCSPHTVWETATDWAGQQRWMLGTFVRVTGGDGQGPGSELMAFTGFGDIGVVDTMRITQWQPPVCCVVRHEGKLIRGSGGFTVVGDETGTGFEWWERFELPAVLLPLWWLLKPLVVWGLDRSLRRFRDRCVLVGRAEA
ncbi:SRPBCC family protein [Actinopolyspora mortivallis]|uniref:SRPBCC family protein n=1 Tax=Actinopolyspora mortivallis TaxID=33906 RepID=A0A2T0H0E9_ACTMO|nr:SRPBCC family protein [Actinopolyspora mortivallis]PRW64835.1 SRPBCC family protein [Actinopolyspora mortivallis]